jgi:hypothetical protein
MDSVVVKVFDPQSNGSRVHSCSLPVGILAQDAVIPYVPHHAVII